MFHSFRETDPEVLVTRLFFLYVFMALHCEISPIKVCKLLKSPLKIFREKLDPAPPLSYSNPAFSAQLRSIYNVCSL